MQNQGEEEVEVGRKWSQCSCNSASGWWAGTQTRQPLCSHLPGLVIVFYLTQVSPAGLRNPLPRDQVPHHHRGRANFWKETCMRKTPVKFPQTWLPILVKSLLCENPFKDVALKNNTITVGFQRCHYNDDDGKSTLDEGLTDMLWSWIPQCHPALRLYFPVRGMLLCQVSSR